MTCDAARDLLFDEQEGLLDGDERTALRAHLDSCAACRAERDALVGDYTLLQGGLRELTAPLAPSARFWQGLEAGLDAVDAERFTAPAPVRLRPVSVRPRQWPRRWIAAAALLAALLSGTVVSGGPQRAWAALRHLLYFIPGISGQIEATALVATAPVASGNGTATLTVTALVSGRRSTLLAYSIRGRGLLAPGPAAPVADAVEAVLVDAQGRRYAPTYVPPARHDLVGGVPRVQGLLAFPALPQTVTRVRLLATRLPFTPTMARPWSPTLSLHPAASGAAQTSRPVDRSNTRNGIRVAVTDVTMAGGATVVDMDAAVADHTYAGARVVSLAPEQASGAFAPILAAGHGAGVAALPSQLPAPVRQTVLPRPEFVFPLAPAAGEAMTLTVPAVGLRLPAHAALVVSAAQGQVRAIALGPIALSIARSEVVTPPAALGLDGGSRLRLTFAFPPAAGPRKAQSVEVVAGGTGYTVSRDDPRLELPLADGQRTVRLTVQNPLLTVRGPWIITVHGRAP